MTISMAFAGSEPLRKALMLDKNPVGRFEGKPDMVTERLQMLFCNPAFRTV